MDRHPKRSKTIGIAVVSLAILGCTVAAWLRWGPDLRGPSHKAEAAYKAGDFKNASTLARDWLSAEPDNPEAIRLYARSLARLGRDENAASLYNGRLRMERMQGEDLYLLGLILERGGNKELAYNVWSKASQDFPPSAELLDGLTRLSYQLQRLEEATDTATRLGNLPGQKIQGEFWKGTIRVALGDPSGAIPLLAEALKQAPKAEGAAFPVKSYRGQLARAYLQLGQPDPALEQLNLMKQDAQTRGESLDPTAAWILSRAYLQKSDLKESQKAAELAGSFRKEHSTLAEPSPYVGSARCVKCHGEIAESHFQTRHSRTFHYGKKLLELPRPDAPLPDPDDPKVRQSLVVNGSKLETETNIRDKVYRAVVFYAFGTEGRYLSYVAKDEEGLFRAFRLSYYCEGNQCGWGRSSGDGGNDDPVQQARGQTIHTRDKIVRCLACHVTNTRNFLDPDADPKTLGPEASDRGIGCERCHGPGGNHDRAIELGSSDLAIASPPAMSAAEGVKLCAECHIVGVSSEIERTPGGENWVRSPGLTMTFSRCYTESQGELSCITCHDPHRASETSAVYYEQKCLKCHSGGKSATPTAVDPAGLSKTPDRNQPTVKGAICKVNPTKDCLGCHMPKVRVPVLHTSLTDHFIRVHEKKAD